MENHALLTQARVCATLFPQVVGVCDDCEKSYSRCYDFCLLPFVIHRNSKRWRCSIQIMMMYSGNGLETDAEGGGMAVEQGEQQANSIM